jgi:ABC-2 type transport system ATP-binding protein
MSIELRIQDAGKRYRRGWALRHCEAVLAPGGITALVGPNGAGKSTLLSAAAGLVSLTEGAILVDGRKVDARPDPAIGYLAQDKPLYRRRRVSDMLAQARDLNIRWDAARARRLTDEAGLRPDDRVGALSGGQRTRLALILVLARRPDLVLLDEPLADLDPLARSQVQQSLMAEAVETGMTVLMSSHILGEVRDTCDALLLLQDGRITLHDDMDELVQRHRVLTGPAGAPLDWLPPGDRVEVRGGTHQLTVLVSAAPPELPTGWTDEPAELEEIVIARMRSAEDSRRSTAEVA